MPPPLLAILSALLQPVQARAAHDGDADFLARLYASTRADLHSVTAEPAFVAALIAMQQRLQGAGYRRDFPAATYLLLEHQGARCGRIVVDGGPLAMRLVDIALLPECRGQGLGSHILHALQGCAARHALPLTLAVHHANAPARRLYLARGFQSCGGNAVSEQMIWNNAQQLPSSPNLTSA
ncbi:MAG: GNAT family N-acetyltransferase [Pseudomonadota bacterium]|nr:GNAT family N-acetyltransferase [Pseudomonadota bacterium]